METVNRQHSYSDISFIECIQGNCTEKFKFTTTIGGEVFAGMLAALVTICRYYVASDRTYRIVWKNVTTNQIKNIDIGFDDSVPVLNKYILATDLDAIYPNFVKTDNFIWPVRTYNGKHTLFLFNDSTFVQGFITGADALTLDFRSYAIGLPYKINSYGNLTHYEISGYDIGLPRQIKLPAPIISFGTNFDDTTADIPI